MEKFLEAFRDEFADLIEKNKEKLVSHLDEFFIELKENSFANDAVLT